MAALQLLPPRQRAALIAPVDLGLTSIETVGKAVLARYERTART